MEFSKGYRGWLLFVLLLANAMNLADRQTMAVLGQAIKSELQLSDTQLGIIQGIGFAIFYTAMGLPLARLAERYSRARIISASVALFGAMAALCGTASSFGRMLLFRVGVGIAMRAWGRLSPRSSAITFRATVARARCPSSGSAHRWVY
jgi:MFS family permease